jgi:hypothetical protein
MDDTGTRLVALVEEERDALLTGDFERMADLVAEKQSLAAILEKDPDAVEILSPLRAAMERNQQLYDRALEGLRSVTARVGELDAARRSIRTYDRLGQEQRIGSASKTTLERRA